MNWKQYLLDLEHKEQWDNAIEYMEGIVEANPDDMDAYIYINFLLMNTLVEVDVENYDVNNCDYYAKLLLEYYNNSYAKFSNNAEYLFCSATTAVFSPWFMGLAAEDYEKMFARAIELDPENLLYQKTYYLYLDQLVHSQQAEKLVYAKLILQENSPLIKEWESRGALGEYLKMMQIEWAKNVLDWEIKRHDPQIVWRMQSYKLTGSDQLIEFMQTTISAYPNDMQAYMYINFLLMNLLVNEKYNQNKHDYYVSLLKKYITESYKKFSDNAECLFCTGVIAAMKAEYSGLSVDMIYTMLTRATELDPGNILYKSADYLYLDRRFSNQAPAALEYAKQILQMGLDLRNQLSWEHRFDEYICNKIIKWAEGVIARDSKAQQWQA